MTPKYIYITLTAITMFGTAYSFDNAHFYRATNFWGEPRLDRPWLTTFDVSVGAGSTTQARNACGNVTPLLNMYGPQNMLKLGQNVPFKDLNTQEDLALELLSRLPCRDGFGQLCFCGKFEIQEANLFLYQNMCNGAFFMIQCPIRQLQISNVNYTDLSPEDSAYPNINTPQWQMFLNLFDNILARYHVDIGGFCKRGAGDLTFLLGWANNYDETTECDYIDFDVAAGILFPTGKMKNEDIAFDIPLGYNGHFAVPLALNLSFGVYDWLTLGFHADALLFIKRCGSLRMKTAFDQNGFINLTKGNAQINLGNLWNGSIYTKADHFAKGFSLLVGYTYSHQEQTVLSPFDTQVFTAPIVNSNSTLSPWDMSTVHFIAEYDFTQEDAIFGPRVGVFYNWNVAGKNIFNTSVGGAYIGLDIACDF